MFVLVIGAILIAATNGIKAIFNVQNEFVQITRRRGQILDAISVTLAIANGEADLLSSLGYSIYFDKIRNNSNGTYRHYL